MGAVFFTVTAFFVLREADAFFGVALAFLATGLPEAFFVAVFFLGAAFFVGVVVFSFLATVFFLATVVFTLTTGVLGAAFLTTGFFASAETL